MLLVQNASVLLLDEPLSALDPFLRIKMRAELKAWQKTLGMTFVHVTHSQEEAMALADLVVVMNNGRIEQDASPHVLFNAPRSEFVARFMGGHNVIATPSGKVAVRNDQMLIAPANPTAPAEGIAGLGATVTDVEYQGTYVLLGLDAKTSTGATGVSVMLPEAEFAQRPYAAGEAVHLSWQAAHTLPG